MTHSSEINRVNPDIGERTLDDFIQKLRATCGRATIELAVRVGALVVDTFYGGDVGRWRRRSKDDVSLRQLASRDDLPLSVPRLYRCVAIYEASLALSAFSTWKFLSVSHVRAVLGLPKEAQETLLSRADGERWTVERIEAEVRALRAPSRRGRPRLPESLRQLAKLRNWLDDFPDALGVTIPASVDARDINTLQYKIRVARVQLGELENHLARARLAG